MSAPHDLDLTEQPEPESPYSVATFCLGPGFRISDAKRKRERKRNRERRKREQRVQRVENESQRERAEGNDQQRKERRREKTVVKKGRKKLTGMKEGGRKRGGVILWAPCLVRSIIPLINSVFRKTSELCHFHYWKTQRD